MDRLDSYLKEHFDVPSKNPSEEAQRRWRSAVGRVVKNPRRRFRMVADHDRRSQDEAQRRSIQVLQLCLLLPATVVAHSVSLHSSLCFASPSVAMPVPCSA